MKLNKMSAERKSRLAQILNRYGQFDIRRYRRYCRLMGGKQAVHKDGE